MYIISLVFVCIDRVVNNHMQLYIRLMRQKKMNTLNIGFLTSIRIASITITALFLIGVIASRFLYPFSKWTDLEYLLTFAFATGLLWILFLSHFVILRIKYSLCWNETVFQQKTFKTLSWTTAILILALII